MATNRCGKFIATHVWVLTICIHASHPLLKRHKRHIAIRDLEPTVLHGIAAYCNGIFYRIFLHVICEFSLRTSVNCTENVTKLLAHTQTRYQVLLSDFFKCLGTRLECVCVSLCEFVNCSLCSPTTPSCTMCGRWVMYMLRTDCKPDRFINGPPVYKPVSRFIIRLACFW